MITTDTNEREKGSFLKIKISCLAPLYAMQTFPTMKSCRRHLKHEGICQSLLMRICCSCLEAQLMFPFFLIRSILCFFTDSWCRCSVISHSLRWIVQPHALLSFYLLLCLQLLNEIALIFQSLIFIEFGFLFSILDLFSSSFIIPSLTK